MTGNAGIPPESDQVGAREARERRIIRPLHALLVRVERDVAVGLCQGLHELSRRCAEGRHSIGVARASQARDAILHGRSQVLAGELPVSVGEPGRTLEGEHLEPRAAEQAAGGFQGRRPLDVARVAAGAAGALEEPPALLERRWVIFSCSNLQVSLYRVPRRLVQSEPRDRWFAQAPSGEPAGLAERHVIRNGVLEPRMAGRAALLAEERRRSPLESASSQAAGHGIHLFAGGCFPVLAEGCSLPGPEEQIGCNVPCLLFLHGDARHAPIRVP